MTPTIAGPVVIDGIVARWINDSNGSGASRSGNEAAAGPRAMAPSRLTK